MSTKKLKTSKYIGVSKQRSKWRIQYINALGREISKAFDTELDAAIAYNKEIEKLNKIDPLKIRKLNILP